MKTRKEDRKSKVSRKRKSSLLGRAAAAGTVIGATFAAHGNTVYAQEMESESAADSESDYTANAQASESEAESVSPESENEAEAQPQSEPKPSSRASWNLYIWQVNLPKNLIRFPQFLLLLSLSLLPRCAQNRLLTRNPLLQLLLNRWLRRISLSLKLPFLPQ
jgi:hypothetical protein